MYQAYAARRRPDHGMSSPTYSPIPGAIGKTAEEARAAIPIAVARHNLPDWRVRRMIAESKVSPFTGHYLHPNAMPPLPAPLLYCLPDYASAAAIAREQSLFWRDAHPDSGVDTYRVHAWPGLGFAVHDRFSGRPIPLAQRPRP